MSEAYIHGLSAQFGPIDDRMPKSVPGVAAQRRWACREKRGYGDKVCAERRWETRDVRSCDRTAENSKLLWWLLVGSILMLTNI
jgi:hypothetical protein